MSFDTPADQATPNEADQLTFNVGDRTFNADSATTKIQSADDHIAKLEAENAAFKLQVEQSTSIDEALRQLQEKNAEPQNSQPTANTSVVSEEQIGEIANKSIAEYLANQRVTDSQTAAQQLAEKTYRETGDTLKGIYGDKTDEAMQSKAIELGIDKQELYQMAKSPTTAQLLLQTMQLNSAPSQSAPQGGFNIGHHSEPTEKFLDYDKPITSSTIADALKQANATY